MKERPILFSGPMVLALLNGTKTQTRRIIKPQPPVGCSIHYMLGAESWLPEEKRTPLRHHWEAWWGPLFESRPEKHLCGSFDVKCPYGEPGDQLWVRETFCPVDDTEFGYEKWIDYRATPKYSAEHPAGWENDPEDAEALKWRPSIHMPRSASRITLEITEVLVQRLQEISEEDAKAEGCEPWQFDPLQPMTTGELGTDSPYRGGYACLWDEIHDEVATWKSNPWVWAVSFKKVAL